MIRKLESVTLICLDTRDPGSAVFAMQKCMTGLEFAEAVLITHKGFSVDDSRIVIKTVDPLNGIDDYSRFMVKEIGNYFSTSHVLVVQWDGFIVNPQLWDDNFLSYDYIGAPWPDREHAVGNGGFSLRSRKLVDALQDSRIAEFCPEDYAICDLYHDLLVRDFAIHFAPNEIASRFSCEMIAPECATLGVHGVGTLHWVMDDRALSEHLRIVPEYVLLGQMGRTLAKDCIKSGQINAARYILTRRLASGGLKQRIDALKLWARTCIAKPTNPWHPIYNAYGAGEYLNNLRGEYYEIPKSLRIKWLRKYFLRAVLLLLTGQRFLQRSEIPAGTHKILWFYDWNTLGDSIMDLSQRYALTSRYQVDICMPSGPADLFKGDPAFHRIYTSMKACPADYDFILLHDISATSMGVKLRKYFSKPWASMINHQQGEQQARVSLTAYRLGQLLRTVIIPERPTLARETLINNDQETANIAVALGGGDPRRKYERWPELLQRIVDQWPYTIPPKFVLLGSGQSAQDELADFPVNFLKTYCDIQLDQPNLVALKQVMMRVQYFIGCDSGLMHLAEALDKPGLALFGHIRPEWRLLPQSRLVARFDSCTVNNMSPDEIAAEFVRVIQGDKTS